MALALLTFTALRAQPAAEDQAAAPAEGELVVLTPFTVSARRNTERYASSAATSGCRVSIDLSDSIQSMAVVTRELMIDTAALRILDATTYAVAGISESTIPNGLDRTTIRGFQTDGQTVDGFNSLTQMNLDPVFIERIEVVKGPNAVLAPAGVPGGTINNVSRRPEFRNFGSVSAEVGLFDSNRIELDSCRVLLPKQLAFRVVAAFQQTEGNTGDFKHTRAVMPMLTHRSPAGAELTLQASFVDWRAQNYMGYLIDPSSGTTNEAKMLAGVNRDLNSADNDFRRERRPEFRFLFTAPINSLMSVRLATRYTDYDADFAQNLPGGITGGSHDPQTGNYVGGVSFSSTAPYAGTPTTQPRIMNRGGYWETNHRIYADLQNDWNLRWKNDWFGTDTVVGTALGYYRQSQCDHVATKSPINYDAPVAVDYVLTGAVSGRLDTINYSQQVYLSEALSLLKDRLILNAGYSYSNYDLAVDNRLTGARSRVSVEAGLKSYGAVVKPLPGVSVYYGHSENAQPLVASAIAAGNPPLTEGTQNEFGVRYESPDKHYSASVARFDIVQSNYAVPNPANLVVPAPVPLLPPLLCDRKAKGWEVEARANLTSSLTLIGNWTSYTNRDPNNVPFRGNAENVWALSGNYVFPKNSFLHGVSVWAGVNHLSRRPGDAASGVTPASTPANIIPRQPSFYLPARTLANVGVTYKYDANWSAQLNITNLTNVEYIAASLNRFAVWPGIPFNARLKLSYSF